MNVNEITTKIPVLFEKKSSCCGCSSCFAACPVGAISMLPDNDGFLYPIIDRGKCICCYRCLSVCAFKIDQNGREMHKIGKN